MRFLSLALCRVHSELPIHLLPGEALRSTKREDPVGEPQVQVQAQRRAFEGREGVHVNRHRVTLMISLKNFLTQIDLALPQGRLVGLAFVPPELAAVGHGRTRCYRQSASSR